MSTVRNASAMQQPSVPCGFLRRPSFLLRVGNRLPRFGRQLPPRPGRARRPPWPPASPPTPAPRHRLGLMAKVGWRSFDAVSRTAVSRLTILGALAQPASRCLGRAEEPSEVRGKLVQFVSGRFRFAVASASEQINLEEIEASMRFYISYAACQRPRRSTSRPRLTSRKSTTRSTRRARKSASATTSRARRPRST